MILPKKAHYCVSSTQRSVGTHRRARHVHVPSVLCSGPTVGASEPVINLEVFVRAGCPHCEAAKHFLNELQRERPSLRIASYDVAEDPAARQRLATLVAERGMTGLGVPAFLIGTELIIGFRSADTTGVEIRTRLDQQRRNRLSGSDSRRNPDKMVWRASRQGPGPPAFYNLHRTPGRI